VRPGTLSALRRFRTTLGKRTASIRHEKILIAPEPGAGITSASLRLETPYGEVASSWRSTPDGLTLDVTVPANLTATVRIPARDGSIDVQEIASGTYHFEAR